MKEKDRIIEADNQSISSNGPANHDDFSSEPVNNTDTTIDAIEGAEIVEDLVKQKKDLEVVLAPEKDLLSIYTKINISLPKGIALQRRRLLAKTDTPEEREQVEKMFDSNRVKKVKDWQAKQADYLLEDAFTIIENADPEDNVLIVAQAVRVIRLLEIAGFINDKTRLKEIDDLYYQLTDEEQEKFIEVFKPYLEELDTIKSI